MINQNSTYIVTCDLCGQKHPHTFNFTPTEDDLNNINDEFDFEVEHCWELHLDHQFKANCYCAGKKGVWCGDCANKYWETESKKIQDEYYQSLEKEAA